MKWFKHDTSASNDARLKKLIIKHGAEGYAIYFHCLELIASDITESKITFELEHDAEIIADNLKIKGDQTLSAIDKVNLIMKYIISLGLFENNNNVITCYKMIKRLDQSMTSNTKMRSLIEKAKQNHDKIMTESCKTRLEETRLEENKEFVNQEIHDDNNFSNKNFNRKQIQQEIARTKLPCKKIIDHLNLNANMNFQCLYQYQILMWNWHRKKYQEKDFIDVINYKCREWLNTDYAKHLTPDTLFGTKFEKYLNQARQSLIAGERSADREHQRGLDRARERKEQEEKKKLEKEMNEGFKKIGLEF